MDKSSEEHIDMQSAVEEVAAPVLTDEQLKAQVIHQAATTPPPSLQEAETSEEPQSEPTPKFMSEEIELPSRGHFYDESNVLSNGKVDIKYMTAKEEDILNDQKLIKKRVVLDRLLEELIVTPNANLDDILVGDKNAIFIAARIFAYGKDYTFKFTDTDTGEEVKETVDLTLIGQKPFDFDKYPKGKNTFEFTLPVSKKVVTYRLLTHRDEKNIDLEIKNLAKFNKGNDKASPEITTRLKYMITSIDGDNDLGRLRSTIDSLLSRDTLAFRRHIRENSPDLDMTFVYTSESGNDHELSIPIGLNFFWPDLDD